MDMREAPTGGGVNRCGGIGEGKGIYWLLYN
jgi:hypothetical protein